MFRQRESERKTEKERDNEREKEEEILTALVWLSVNLGKHTDQKEMKNDWDIANTTPWR